MNEAVSRYALVARARAGDEGAWIALYRGLYPQLSAYARRRLDADAARDAVSEAMARAVARIQGFSAEGGGFDAWVFGILRHVVVDAQRAACARPANGELDEVSSNEPGALERLLGWEQSSAVRAAFARLDPADQEVLELRIMAGLSSEEVAAVIGKRPGAVRMAQSRALGRLREMLAMEEEAV